MKRVLVTGATGYIGSWAVVALHKVGFDVHGTSRKKSGTIDSAAIHRIDLLSESAREIIEKIKPSHLLLAAWVTKHHEYWTSSDNDQWLAANTAIAKAFLENGGRRIVFAGSCAEYDWSDPLLHKPVKEDEAQSLPTTLYGRAKKEAARQIEELVTLAGSTFANGRIFFPIGLKEAPKRLLPSIIAQLREGKDPILRHPDLVRDFIDVRDAGAALATLVTSDVQGPVNIGSGSGVRLHYLATRVAALLDRQDVLRYQTGGERAIEPPFLVADTSRLNRTVGFAPQYSLDQTLASAISSMPASMLPRP